MGDLFWLYPMPLLIALFLIYVFGEKLQEKASLVGAFGSATVFFLLMSKGSQIFNGKEFNFTFEWFKGIELGFRLDSLSWIMSMLVTFLVTMILVYSFSYMKDEKGLRRFFSFMVLFGLSMVQLILADNLLQMFIAWEIMGLCSYSLIGFYFEKNSAAAAGKKAFLTTRVGDVIMLVGLLVLYSGTGSFKYDAIFAAAANGTLPLTEIVLATLLIFAGVMGKSAQFPLHIWLPDAMEGPTPVSALIHAAAMVKAGMYLVIRLYPLFVVSQFTLNFVMIIGTITVIFAALMAIFADDFKQVLAFSTISQLGYMTVALGCLGAIPALLHVVNHAFFKALLFLGAGSVIHSVGTGDIRQMGGVLKYQKITGITMLLATLSISGVPGFSGFVSKDEILLQVYQSGNMWSYYILLLTSMLTAFYMFRLFFLVFMGKKRSDYDGHESPNTMTFPLIILAVAAVFSGRLKNPISEIMSNFGNLPHHENLVMYSSIAVVSIGIIAAFFLYYLKIFEDKKLEKMVRGPKVFFQNRYYFDFLVEQFCKYFVIVFGFIGKFVETYIIDGIVNGVATVTMGLASISELIDVYIIDGFVNGVAAITRAFSSAAEVIDVYVFDGAIRGIENVIMIKGRFVSAWSTGRIQSYLTWTIAGVIAIVLIIGGVMQ